MSKLIPSMPKKRERGGGEEVSTQIAIGPIRGEWGQVEWATDGNGNRTALSYYPKLADRDKAKINALLKLLADLGFIDNREKFKKLGSKAKGEGSELWEFKSFQLRFLGDYRQNGRFIIAHAFRKNAITCQNLLLRKPFAFSKKTTNKRKESHESTLHVRTF